MLIVTDQFTVHPRRSLRDLQRKKRCELLCTPAPRSAVFFLTMATPVVGTVFELTKACAAHRTAAGMFAVVMRYEKNHSKGDRFEAGLQPRAGPARYLRKGADGKQGVLGRRLINMKGVLGRRLIMKAGSTMSLHTKTKITLSRCRR